MTIKFYEDECELYTPTGVWPTKITVTDEDTFTAASRFENACCLNFASHRRPGGGYKALVGTRMPIKTQEEDLFRRSNLPDVMDRPSVREHYPLKGREGLYCEARVTKDNKCDALKKPFTVSVVTVPAVVNPRPDQQQLVKDRISRILEIAAYNKAEVLILGAWGCGVFNNDPEVIAGYFKELLEGPFDGVFREVVFAIPGKESANHLIFERVLSEA